MAVTVSLRMTVDNNENQVRQLFSVPSEQSFQDFEKLDSAIIDVSTTLQTVTLSNVGTNAGYSYFRNVSVRLAEINGTAQTNYSSIVIGPMSGTNLIDFVALKAGEPAVLPLKTTVQLGVKLQTASTVETQSIWSNRLHFAVNGR